MSGWSIAHLAGRLVTLPGAIVSLSADILTNNASAFSLDRGTMRLGSVYGMTLGNPLIRGLVKEQIAQGIHAHSIIPTLGDGPLEGRTDGVVAYASAHIEGVASEFIVEHSPHSTQGDSRTINEVRRILLLHLMKSCTGAACR
ncbi:hypothetical protein MVG78_20665 (plasmid) [Roseomonas gilardii subsp. gilardii]|uniref:hypothetical protein n=1 Tax=Roseomonas gilardii TaxID=257708 RepID=UPI001FFB655C|nr:hypothetical protein [Roseomonas gilardii]UPG74514.1 hypothetical protein MVG78_20665 [Roseomonas gilardii subsp. gilardii]